MAPTSVVKLIFGTPFGIFLESLPARVKGAAGLVTALGARWWNTIHTFHWSCGEMMMTPLDLYALTGIASGGIPIEIDMPLWLSEAGIIGALGWFSERRGPGDSVPQGTLLAHLASERARVAAAGGVMTGHEARQYARVLLLLTCH